MSRAYQLRDTHTVADSAYLALAEGIAAPLITCDARLAIRLAMEQSSWQLRADLSSYDAAYVALAEILAAPLVTLDRRIVRAPGISCAVSSPASSG